MSQLPTYAARSGGRLSDGRIRDYHDAGVRILEHFVSLGAGGALRHRADQLVPDFDPETARSVFSTTEKRHLGDRYFIESGDKIRFVLKAAAIWLQRSPTLPLRGLDDSRIA